MKEDLSNGMYPVTHPAPRDNSGVGYVIVPQGMTVDEARDVSCRNGLVTIITEASEIIKNVRVPVHVINELDWTKVQPGTQVKGSAVFWVNVPGKNIPTITGILLKRDAEFQKGVDNGFMQQSKNPETDTHVTVLGEGNTGNHSVSTSGVNRGESQVKTTVYHNSGLGKIIEYVQGNKEVNVENNHETTIGNNLNITIVNAKNPQNVTQISYEIGKGLNYRDEFNNFISANKDGLITIDSKDIFVKNKTSLIQSEDNAEIRSKEIILRDDIKSDLYSGLLGERTEDVLNEIVNTISGLQTSLNSLKSGVAAALSGTPTVPSLGAAITAGLGVTTGDLNKGIIEIKNKIKLIKSKIVKLS